MHTSLLACIGLPLLVTAHTFQHLYSNTQPPLQPTGIVGDGAPQIESSYTNPYTKGSPYGTSFSDRNSIGTGTFSGYGYTPMGAAHGFGAEETGPWGTEDRNVMPGFPWGGTAYNYSSPWEGPGPHPMWPKPPSPYGIRENDPRNVGLSSWNQSGTFISNFTRYGLGGADSFSPFRQYKYRMGDIPSSWAWRYSGRPGGEPTPFRNPYGTIPSTVPEGMVKGNTMQREAMNKIMPMGSTTDQIRSRGEGVLWPFGNKGGSESGASFLQLLSGARSRTTIAYHPRHRFVSNGFQTREHTNNGLQFLDDRHMYHNRPRYLYYGLHPTKKKKVSAYRRKRNR